MTQQRSVYTTGQVADLCGVSPKTVVNWFNRGDLKGWRFPGHRGPNSGSRRIYHEELLAFLRRRGYTRALAMITPEVQTVLLAGMPPALAETLTQRLANCTVRTADDLFTLGLAMHDPPSIAVVDLSLGGREEVRRAVMKLIEDCCTVAVILPEDAPSVLRVAFQGVRVFQHPVNAEELVALVHGQPEANGVIP